MLIFEPTLTFEPAVDRIREDALTVCEEAVAGRPPVKSLRVPVHSIQITPFDLAETEWKNFLRGLNANDTISDSLERTIVRYLADIPEVTDVYFAQQGDVIDIWTIISSNSKEIRHKVYAKELEIINEIPGFVLNFRVSGQMGSSTPISAGYRKVDMISIRSDVRHQRSSF